MPTATNEFGDAVATINEFGDEHLPESRPERGQRLRTELASVRQEPAALSDPNAPAPSPVTDFQGSSETTLMPPGEEYRQFRLPRAGAPGIQPVTTFQGPSEVILQPEQQARTTGEILQNTASAAVEGLVSPMTPPFILGTIAAPEVVIPALTAQMGKSGSIKIAEGLVDLQQGRHEEGVQKLGEGATELGFAAAPALHTSPYTGKPTPGSFAERAGEFIGRRIAAPTKFERSLDALRREPIVAPETVTEGLPQPTVEIRTPEDLPVPEQPLTEIPNAIHSEAETPIRDVLKPEGESQGAGQVPANVSSEEVGARGVTGGDVATEAKSEVLLDAAGNPAEFYSLPRLRAANARNDPQVAAAKKYYGAKTIPDLARLAKARFEEMAAKQAQSPTPVEELPAPGMRTAEDIEMARVRALPESAYADPKLIAEDIAKAVDTVNVEDIAGYPPVPALVRLIERASRDPAMKPAAEQAMQKIGKAAREQGVPLDDIKNQVAGELKAVYGADAPEMAKYYFGETPAPEAAAFTPEELAEMDKEVAASKALVDREWPPVYKRIQDATGLAKRDLEKLGVYESVDHPSDVRNLARDITANAPGGKMNKLYDQLAAEGHTGRFLWGGTADAPTIGFDPDVPGARPDPVAAKKAWDAVNAVRGVFGHEPLPDFFGAKAAAQAPKPAPAAKEPWQMTRSDWGKAPGMPPEVRSDTMVLDAQKQLDQVNRKYGNLASLGSGKKADVARKATAKAEDVLGNVVDAAYRTAHRESVERALREGKPVPPEVLADYPDLAKPAPEPPATAGTTTGVGEEPFRMTFEQFQNAPREGRLLEELRKVPKREKTPEQIAAAERDAKATEAVDKAKLSWIFDRSNPAQKRMVESAIRNLPKAKKKIVDEYEAALTAKIKSDMKGQEGRQRELYDALVSKGVIAPPEPPTRPETPAVPPGPGAASPSEFAERTAKGAGAMPPAEPPIALDASENPSPEIVRRAKDFNIFNKANSGQWSFYFGKLGKTAKAAWDEMALTGFRLRENTKRDTERYVKNLLSSLPREVRKGGGEAFFDVLDGRTMDQIEAQWAGKPKGQSVIDAAQQLKSRLEDIRTTIRDTKREAYNGFLMSLDRPTLSQLFDANISNAIDTSKYSKEMFADALTRNELPDDWGISDGSYLPHIFFGNWKVTAQRGATPEFVTRARTPSEAKARIFEYVKANPDYAKADWKVEPDAVVPADILRLTDNRFWRMLNQMKDSLGVSASEIKQAQQGIIGKKSSKQKWFGNLQQREGYKGYSKDYEKVMSAYLSGFHRWLELSRLQREVQPMIDEVRSGNVDEMGNRTTGPRPRAAEALEDIMDYMWGKPARSTLLFDSFLQNIPVLRDRVKPLALDRYSQSIRSLVPYLTLSTARFAVVNRLQPLQGLYPLVGERIMAQAKRFQHTPEGRKLLDDAGVFFDPGQYGFERGFTGKLSDIRERFTGERSNQELAFLAMFQHGTESGLPRGEAINYAKLRGQLLTQFTPNAADIPPIMRGPISGLLLQFKRFPIKQAELLVKMGAEKRFGGLARWFTVMAATGGLSYFLKQAWAPAETREKIRRSITNEYGQTVADAVMYGLPGLANVDLSGSLTIGDEPFGANIYEKIGRTATGPAGGMAIDTATQLLTAAREPTTVTQDALTLLRKFPTTKPIAELIALANSDLDVRTPDGEVKYRKAIKDAIVGIGSFKTASEANLQSAVNGWIAIEKEATSLKNAAFVEMMKPNGNSANALDAIQKFNERWPERAISGPELNRYIHTRAKGMGKTDYERAVGKRGGAFLPEQP